MSITSGVNQCRNEGCRYYNGHGGGGGGRQNNYKINEYTVVHFQEIE